MPLSECAHSAATEALKAPLPASIRATFPATLGDVWETYDALDRLKQDIATGLEDMRRSIDFMEAQLNKAVRA